MQCVKRFSMETMFSKCVCVRLRADGYFLKCFLEPTHFQMLQGSADQFHIGFHEKKLWPLLVIFHCSTHQKRGLAQIKRLCHWFYPNSPKPPHHKVFSYQSTHSGLMVDLHEDCQQRRYPILKQHSDHFSATLLFFFFSFSCSLYHTQMCQHIQQLLPIFHQQMDRDTPKPLIQFGTIFYPQQNLTMPSSLSVGSQWKKMGFHTIHINSTTFLTTLEEYQVGFHPNVA